jgi:hypothetical protein
VLEREVDRTEDRTSATQLRELVMLSLAAGHGMTMRPCADGALHGC